MRNGDDKFVRHVPVWWWVFFAVGIVAWGVIIFVAWHFIAKWW